MLTKVFLTISLIAQSCFGMEKENQGSEPTHLLCVKYQELNKYNGSTSLGTENNKEPYSFYMLGSMHDFPGKWLPEVIKNELQNLDNAFSECGKKIHYDSISSMLSELDEKFLKELYADLYKGSYEYDERNQDLFKEVAKEFNFSTDISKIPPVLVIKILIEFNRAIGIDETIISKAENNYRLDAYNGYTKTIIDLHKNLLNYLRHAESIKNDPYKKEEAQNIINDCVDELKINTSYFDLLKENPEIVYCFAFKIWEQQRSNFSFVFADYLPLFKLFLDYAQGVVERLEYKDDLVKRNQYWLKETLLPILTTKWKSVAVFGAGHMSIKGEDTEEGKYGILDFILDMRDGKNLQHWLDFIGKESTWFNHKILSVERLYNNGEWKTEERLTA